MNFNPVEVMFKIFYVILGITATLLAVFTIILSILNFITNLENKHEFKYLDKIHITSGFYEEMNGILIGCDENNQTCKVKLDYNKMYEFEPEIVDVKINNIKKR